MLKVKLGDTIERARCCDSWSACSTPGTTWPSPAVTFRVRGDTIEVIPMYEELAVRIEHVRR